MQEHDRIQRGHVHAFGQAAGVGQDAAGLIGSFGLEPVQQFAACLGVEGAIDMPGLNPKWRILIF